MLDFAGKLDPCAKTEEKTPKCSKECESGYSVSFTADKHHGVSARSFPGVEAIQTEIMTNGPVEGTMRVYSDFPSYKSGKECARMCTETQRLQWRSLFTGLDYWTGHQRKI
jgi:hypothetical protein